MEEGITRKDGEITKEVSFEMPDLEPDEDPITPNQLRYIKKLAPQMEIEGGLENIGKWQASAIIDFLKDQQEILEDDIANGKYAKGGCLGIISLFMLSGLVLSNLLI